MTHTETIALIGLTCTAAWLALGYHNHLAHQDGRRLPWWEVTIEFVAAFMALFCLLRLVLDPLLM